MKLSQFPPGFMFDRFTAPLFICLFFLSGLLFGKQSALLIFITNIVIYITIILIAKIVLLAYKQFRHRKKMLDKYPVIFYIYRKHWKYRMSKGSKLCEEIHITDKFDYYKKHNPFVEVRFNKKLQCLHCGKEFTFNEFKVVREKNSQKTAFIVCKHFPKCHGSLIDFMSDMK